jgi:hypothetical protein
MLGKSISSNGTVDGRAVVSVGFGVLVSPLARFPFPQQAASYPDSSERGHTQQWSFCHAEHPEGKHPVGVDFFLSCLGYFYW